MRNTPVTRPGRFERAEVVRQQAQHEEQHEPFERRLVELARMARRRLDVGVVQRASGNTMPHGTSVGRPNSSPLMKLAMRPKNNPIGTAAVTRSPVLQRTDAVAARERPDRDDAADERAVERHAALPDRDDVLRIGEVVARLVEQTKPRRPPSTTPAVI